mgnify:CR=1 FL=1
MFEKCIVGRFIQMSLWFYVWIITSIIFGIYIFYDYFKQPEHFKLLNKKEREDSKSLRRSYDGILVLGQWLFFTLFLGYILMIFS